MLYPSRLAAVGRWGLLAFLLSLLALLGPAAPLGPAPTANAADHAAKPVALRLASPPAFDERGARFDDLRPRLRTFAAPIVFTDASSQYRDAPVVVAGSGILVDIDTNRILWSANAHVQRAPASTTKMMSALVAMNNFDPDQEIVVPESSTEVLYVETRLGLIPGERLTMRELLSGMLMVSANDAALAVAQATVGMDDFVVTMNRQAAELGLTDSHFVGPVGFPDDPAQVSSAYDLAAIATAGYRQFPLFRELTGSRDGLLAASPKHQEYKLHNINRLMDIYPAAIGTKSGFTDDAGPVLVSMAERNGHHLVAVLMNAPKMFDQSRWLMEWGFTHEGVPAMYPPGPPPVAPPR